LTETAASKEPLEATVEPIKVVGVENDSRLVAIAPFDGDRVMIGYL
jgi:hypothetical protein